MSSEQILTALVTVLTSSGFVATLTTIAGVIAKARSGQKIREHARREQLAASAAPAPDLLTERQRADAAETAYDQERALRRTWQDLAHELRRACIDHGTPLTGLPAFPDEPQPLGGTP